MGSTTAARETFGKVSELYETSRIGYPTQLIEDIIIYSKIRSNSSILDVGCGSGQLTFPFAQHGFKIMGLDLSKDMITLASKKCSQFLNVNFKLGLFEEAQFPNKTFNLIVSGMAWHWVTSEDRYDKINRLLTKDGALALCWSYQYGEAKFRQDVGKILDKYGKSEGQTGPKIPLYAASAHEELKKNSLFKSVIRKEYQEDIKFSKEKYLNLVLTYHWVQLLSENKREKLVQDFHELYNRYGEILIIPYKFVVIIAKKK